MDGGIRRLGWPSKAGLAAAAGLLAAYAFVILDRTRSFAIVVGARAFLAAIGLGLGVALAVVAALERRESRTPTLKMPVPGLLRLIAWWCGVTLSLTLLSLASWRVWGIACFFAAIAALVKAWSVFTYVKQSYEFHVWAPFAVIIGVVFAVGGVLMFVSRPNTPPPIDAALRAYIAEPIGGDAASRSAPDLSGAEFSLTFQGDVDLGGLPASFFSYQLHGSRVDVYVARVGFPPPAGSTWLADPPGWEIDRSTNLFLRSRNEPIHLLAVGDSEDAVDAFIQAYDTLPDTSDVTE